MMRSWWLFQPFAGDFSQFTLMVGGECSHHCAIPAPLGVQVRQSLKDPSNITFTTSFLKGMNSNYFWNNESCLNIAPKLMNRKDFIIKSPVT